MNTHGRNGFTTAALRESWLCQQQALLQATMPRATESQPQVQASAHRLPGQHAVGLSCPHRAPQKDLSRSGVGRDIPAHSLFESLHSCVGVHEQLLQLSMRQSKTWTVEPQISFC